MSCAKCSEDCPATCLQKVESVVNRIIEGRPLIGGEHKEWVEFRKLQAYLFAGIDEEKWEN